MALTFTPEKHEYLSIDPNDNITWTSATRLVDCFKPKFDSVTQSIKSSKNKKSKWYGISPEEIQSIWSGEGNRANTLGTFYHNQREEDLLSCETITISGIEVPIIKPIYDGVIKHAPAQNLTEGIYPEHFVYLKSAGICGQSDRVEVIQGVVNIIDYKGLCIETPIPTKNGFKLMKHIRVGDIIYDGNGKLTKVDHVSGIHFNPCYKITFDTNESLICDHEHKWIIEERKNTGKYNTKNYKVEYKEEEKNTNELLDLFNKNSILRIKCESLKNKNKDLIIDPYVLGIWLGDGSKQSGQVTNMTKEIWLEIENRGYKLGKDISQGGSGKAESKTIYGIYPLLKKLNLINNKHIPNIYLRSSHQQRLELLRGLMDSDGYLHRTRKRCVMNTTQKWQAESIMELVSSLGYKPTIIDSYASFNGKKTKAYQITFKMLDESPFLIRNIDYYNIINRKHKYQNNEYRIIKNIELIKTVPTKCLSVISTSHSYLAGRTYIKTHNTNKEIKKESYTSWDGIKQKMQGPLEHINDCNFWHYAVQLSLYLYIILKHNPTFKPGKLILHHIAFENEGLDKYGYPITKLDHQGNPIVTSVTPYEVPYLKSEVIAMINWLHDNKHLIPAKHG